MLNQSWPFIGGYKTIGETKSTTTGQDRGLSTDQREARIGNQNRVPSGIAPTRKVEKG